MEGEFLKGWGNFSLSEEEDVDVDVQVIEVKKTVTRGQSYIVGKLVAEQLVSKETLKTTLRRWWMLSGAMTLNVLGDKLIPD
jgi:hypothetical protein